MDVAFWTAVALVLYAYAGYPCALALIGLVRRWPVLRAPITPHVTFIITAYNEEGRIAAKLANTLRQRYPGGRLEIIVASDASTDGTDAVVRAHAPRVRLVRSPERRGKEAAQLLAVEAAAGEILVFSDAATILDDDGVATIVQRFADPMVGCVSSVDRFVDADGRVSGEGAYVRYEMKLRALETSVNSLVGLSGSFFAARRTVCREWAVDRQSDFSTLLRTVEMGLRGVLDPACAGYYRSIAEERDELHRKVRTVVLGLAVLAANRRLLNPFRYGLFAWQLASHKLCRWLVPFAMVVAVVTNAVLATQSAFYLTLLGVQAAFYAAALVGLWRRTGLLRLPAFLLVANVAVVIAWVRFARGDRFTSWTPSRRLPHWGQTGVKPGSDESQTTGLTPV
jgi:glycosyltransferase involved in cell wall biosynthesis